MKNLKDIFPVNTTSRIEALRCYLAKLGELLCFKPSLTFDPESNILVSTYINGKKASTTIDVSSSQVATEDIPVVLANGKSLGKYVSGQVVPGVGKSYMEILKDIAMEYVNPSFSLFTVEYLSATVEVGTILQGFKSFKWNIIQNSGEVTSVDIYDITANEVLAAGLLNDGQENITVNTISLDTTLKTQSWKAIGNNENGSNPVSSVFTISTLFRRFHGTSDNADLATLDISALQNSELSGTRLQTKVINGEGKYMVFAYPASFGVATFIVNGLTNNAFTSVVRPFTNNLDITEDYIIYRTNTLQFGTLTIKTE